MTAKEIHLYLTDYFGYAEPDDYDNCGFICGDPEASVSGILVCLDVTRTAVRRAKEVGANLIISHHPPIFKPIRSILVSDAREIALIDAIKSGITVYSAHTNMDDAKNGLCERFAKIAGIKEPKTVVGGARVGELDEETTLCGLSEKIAREIGDRHIKTAGNPDGKVKTVAVVNGAGGRIEEIIDEVIAMKCGAYVSAEFKYSDVLRLVESGVGVIELGHYDSEKHFVKIAADALRKKSENVGIEEFYFNPYN